MPHFSQVRSDFALGSLIQNPKIPSSVSETLAAHIYANSERLGQNAVFKRNDGADFSVSKGQEKLLVEVKGSGLAEFQTMGPKDRKCEALLWLRFGDVSEMSLDTPINWTIFEPKICFEVPLRDRVTYSQAEKAANGKFKSGIVTISRLFSL